MQFNQLNANIGDVHNSTDSKVAGMRAIKKLEIRLCKLGPDGPVGVFVASESAIAVNLDAVLTQCCLQEPGEAAFNLLLSVIITLHFRRDDEALRDLEYLAGQLIRGEISIQQFEATR